MMTKEEIRDLVGCYIHVEGYDDLRSILSIMSQEYPQEFDRREAMKIIREVLREELCKVDDVSARYILDRKQASDASQ